VRNPEEAQICVAEQVDLVDVKEPAHGPMGAADVAVLQAVVAAVGGRCRVTAAGGELRDWRASGAQPQPVHGELAMLKVGLAGYGDDASWADHLRIVHDNLRSAVAAGSASQLQLVPVAYADHAAANSPRPLDAIQLIKDSGLRWLMIDTFDKSSRGVFELLSDSQISSLVLASQQAGLGIALAGRIGLAELSHAARTGADVVGVRGAVCRGGRLGTLSHQAVDEARRRLKECCATGHRVQAATDASGLAQEKT